MSRQTSPKNSNLRETSVVIVNSSLSLSLLVFVFVCIVCIVCVYITMSDPTPSLTRTPTDLSHHHHKTGKTASIFQFSPPILQTLIADLQFSIISTKKIESFSTKKMQNPYSQVQAKPQQPQFPEQEQLKCPRCDSPNTKFCYYNNYNLSQPRHFCRSCKRYWTKGGTLRNIPVGGGSRKTSKRSSSENSSAASKRPAVAASPPKDGKSSDQEKAGEVFDTLPLRGENFSGQFDCLSFSSLLDSGGDHFAGLLDPNGPAHFDEAGPGPDANPGLDVSGGGEGDEFLNLQGGGGGDWPDLAIYTPSSNFQ